MQQPTVKINQSAFSKLIYLRDKTDNEVAMLGQTKEEDPLHVIDFHLVKQKVGHVSADMDDQAISDFELDMINKGVMPMNSTRFWAHTHPMTGTNSASPSNKDMGTWNNEENSQKTLFVMFILSKSGEMTCKVRIKASPNIPGLSHKIEKEFEAKIEIVDDIEDATKQVLEAVYGAIAVERIDKQILIKCLSTEEMEYLFPWKKDLDAQYDKLVEEPIVRGSNYMGFQYWQQTPTKKDDKLDFASPKLFDVTTIVAALSEHAFAFGSPNNQQEDSLRKLVGIYPRHFSTIRALLTKFDGLRNTPEYKPSMTKLLQGVIPYADDVFTINSMTFKSLPINMRLNIVHNIGTMFYPEITKYVSRFNGDAHA